MFWKKKKKLTITEDDKNWVDNSLNWLFSEFGEEYFLNIQTITPTKNFYDRKFDKTEKDAEFILKKTAELMSIGNIEIKLDFFDDDIVKMEDGTVLLTPEDEYGKWESSTGQIEINNNKLIISIENQQLKNPISLIATISHELAHQKLLGENRITENDEFLTDLTAIAFGFGIFIGNSRNKFTQFSTNDGYGWESSSQGYLPEEIISYSMAWLSNKRNENLNYSKYLKPSLDKLLKQSFEYLVKNEKE